MDPLTKINTRQTLQSEQADPRQVKNHAGGFTFEISDEERLRRFLILGSTSGTYYQSPGDLTKENASVVIKFAATNPVRLVEILIDISVNNRAPKQNPIIFSLAVAAASPVEAGRKAAFDAMPAILRTGTQFLMFHRYVKQFRGWGMGLRKAGQRWMDAKDVDALAYQFVKYRNREGYTQRDLLRLIHPKTQDEARNALYQWVTNPQPGEGEALPRFVQGFTKAQDATTVKDWVSLISEYHLSWEMLPTQALKEKEVWAALLDNGLPMTALIRQLPRLTNLSLLGSGLSKGSYLSRVVEQLGDAEYLAKARIHPFNVLVAQRTYAAGRSFRGNSTWSPSQPVVNALDKAFYLAFSNVTPANKRTMLALDVSGSMGSLLLDSPISAREGAAAMALITMATEPAYEVFGFTSGAHQSQRWSNNFRHGDFTPLQISPRQRLDDVVKYTSGLPFSGTDCALPMVKALELGLEVDTFVVYTDSETWAGDIHPHQALVKYRQKTGIDARCIVVGMTSTGFSIADPTDAGMLDCVGWDSAAPSLIADFSGGRI